MKSGLMTWLQKRRKHCSRKNELLSYADLRTSHEEGVTLNNMKKKIYIITNKAKDPDLAITRRVQGILEKKGYESTLDDKPIPEKIDYIVVLGGDGTLLQTARDMVDFDAPLLGINLGTLGYLTAVEVSGLGKALERIENGQAEIESRMMLKGIATRNGKIVEEAYALNDIALTRAGSLQIINFSLYVNGQFLNTYEADGIIVSTPTGSTGYNLSAGGPIVEPKAKLMVLTPICPHTLNTRSIVLSAEDEVVIEIGEGRNNKVQKVELNFDGTHMVELITGDKVVITKSSKVTKIVKISHASFLEVLHKKMSNS